MLHLPETNLKQTQFYKDVFSEGRQEGMEEGRQRELDLVLRLLARRLGPVSEADRARVSALPIENLEALGEALLDFADPADFAAWLAAH